MKSAYADVTHWLAFNAQITRLEYQLCNAGCITPWVGLFMTGETIRAGAPGEILSAIEELSGIVWLMEREHTSLSERLRELFAPRAPLALPEEMMAALAPANGISRNLAALRRSIETRMTLIGAHPGAVDAHSRLILRRHWTVMSTLVMPALKRVETLAEGAASGSDMGADAPDWPTSRYQDYLPAARRPHPDDFLALSLLTQQGP